jgi:hypothetical protein
MEALMNLPTLIAAAPVVGVLLAGCALMKNTPQQDYVWELAKHCKVGGAYVARVDADGRWWTNVQGPGWEIDQAKLRECMAEQSRATSYREWLRKNGGAPAPARALKGDDAL